MKTYGQALAIQESKLKKTGTKVVTYTLALFVIFYSTFPFYWAFVTSLRSGTELFSSNLIPEKIHFTNYVYVFQTHGFGENIWNSISVACSTVVLSVLIALFAAFSLARRHFKGRKFILYTVLGISMFPQIAVLSGLFEVITALKLYNNTLALTLSYMIFTLPFTVWMLTTSLKTLPVGLEEAAVMDGAGMITILFRIFLPLLWPSVATTSLFAFIAAWNEFMFALTFTLTEKSQTVPVAIAMMSGTSAYESPWGSIMAASVLVTTPLIILALIFQRKIVAGLTAGSVKG